MPKSSRNEPQKSEKKIGIAGFKLPTSVDGCKKMSEAMVTQFMKKANTEKAAQKPTVTTELADAASAAAGVKKKVAMTKEEALKKVDEQISRMTGGVVKKLPTTAEEVKKLGSGVIEGLKNYAVNEAKRIGADLIQKKGGEFLSKLSGASMCMLKHIAWAVMLWY